MGVLLLGLVLLAGGLAFLALRPLEVGFVTPRIEAALQPADGSLRVEIGRSTLGFGLTRGLELRLFDARVLDPRDAEVLRLPSVVVDLSAIRLLWGDVAVTGVALDSPSARVVRDADGGLEFVVETPGASADSRPLDARLAAIAGGDAPLGSVRRLRIRDAELRFEDRARGLDWTARGLELEVKRRSRGLTARTRAELDLAGSRGTLEATLEWERGADAVKVETRLEGVDLGAVLAAFLTPEERAGLPSLPVDGTIGSRWALAPEPRPLELRLDLAGVLRPGASRPSHPRLALSGRLDPEAAADRLELEVRMDSLELSDLAGLWPPALAGDTRAWIVENLPAGRVHDGTLRASAQLEPDGAGVAGLSLAGSLEADDLVVRYLAPLPEARAVAASVSFDLEHWDFTLRGGHVRDVEIRGGSVSIRGLGESAQPRLALDLQLDGPVRSVLEILALPPLEVGAFDPARVAGRAEGRLGLALPLTDRAPGAVQLEVEARIHAAALEAPSPLPALSDGEFQLSVRDGRLTLDGPAQLGGRPGHFTWTHVLLAAQRNQHMELRGALPAQGAERPLDFRLEAERSPERWLDGRARFALDATSESSADYSTRDGDRRLTVRSPDLGELVKALTGAEKLDGGRLGVDGAAPDPAAPLTGRFVLEDFALAETAVLRRLLGALGLGELLAAGHLAWQDASGGFSQLPDGLEIRGARLAGEVLAFTLEGRLSAGTGALDLRGEAVPLRRVNSLVGGIPVFGPLVTGGSEGLVSAHYRITGSLADPVVRVDPWSSLVPAPVRELLEAGGSVGRAGADALRR